MRIASTGPPNRSGGRSQQGGGDGVDPLAELVVDLPAQLIAHRHVGERRHQEDDDGHGRDAAERQSGADAHASRSTYPTPRTVWMRRGSPPSSSLRRRLEM